MDLNKNFIEKILYPAMEKFKNNNIRKYLDEMKKTENYSYDKLSEYQNEKLKKLLLHSIDKVPAYKKYKNITESIKKDPYEALKKFPILTKKEFMKNNSNYLSAEANKENLIPNTTGGSTGEPVKFYIDRFTVEHYEAARWRGLSWWDISFGDSSVMIWGSPIELSKSKDIKYKLKERLLKNRIILPAYNINPEEIPEYIETLEKFNPSYIYGYASALYAFAKLILEGDYSINIDLKGVLSTAETLHQYQREIIEKAFKTKTINEYGARDGGIIGYQCKEGNMHIPIETLVLEIIDMKTGERVKEGESGSVVVTDLNNFSMPRLRYELGDVAKLSKHFCKCGRQLPIIDEIEGRQEEIFLSKNGSLVHGHYWNHIARNSSGISQFQLIQHDYENVTLKIVKNDNFKKEEEKKFRQEINEVLGVYNIKVIYCNEIAKSKSGKFRYAIREFPIDIDN